MKNIKFKEPALTAISYLIPIVVAGGFLLAIGNIFGGEAITEFKGTIRNMGCSFNCRWANIRNATGCCIYRNCVCYCR